MTEATQATQTIQRKRAIRSAHRGVITKYIYEAAELLNEEQINCDRLTTIQGLLDEKLDVVKRLDNEILEVCELKDIEKNVEEAEEIISRVLDIKKNITKVTSDAAKKSPANNDNPSTNINESLVNVNDNVNNLETSAVADIDQLAQVSQHHYVTKTKLPKLVLPKFKGDLTSFRSFWDSYESAVHKNTELSKIDKFNYLYSLLEGSALRAIQGLSLTEENYQAAVDLLTQRFGKTQQVISAHMDELLKIPACSGDKSTQLRFVYDKISVNVRGLDALGVDSSQYGSLLIPIIMSKLPSEIRIQIARNTATEVWKITDILEVIRKEVEARETSENVRADNDHGHKPEHRNQNRNQSSASNLFVKNEDTDKIQPKCVYCGEFHFSASCTRVKDLNKRKDILTRDKRCYLCLRRGHTIRECKKQRNCRRCEGKHHQSICQRDSTKRNEKQTEPVDENRSNENENAPSITTSTTRSSSKVLLQTATTFAYSTHDATTIPVRVLMDSGSQRTYVTHNLKERLNLQPTKTETLKLNTFGGDRFSRKRCDIVELNLQGIEGDIEISAVCFPKICSPISVKVCLDNHPHLKGLNLADASLTETDQETIDILIGADYYFDIMNDEIVRGEKGPVAVSSKFGWILAGPTKDATMDEQVSMAHLITEVKESQSVTSPYMRSKDDELVENLRRFWETESIGISEPKMKKTDEFLRDVQFDKQEGRYEVGLPWKEDCSPQSTGYSACVRRLRQLHSRLKKDQVLLNEYDTTIKRQLESGIIEEVPNEDDGEEGTYYLPHHGVVREDKQTTKLRVVFDGSAKPNMDSPSINESLEKGPNLVPNLFDTIIKFREYRIGIIADIEKAFHQIQIMPTDRRMLRFLWFDNVKKKEPQIKKFQFQRLVFGLTPSPAILASVIQRHLYLHREKDPEMVSLLNDSFYVDDFAGGAQNDEDALDVYERAQALMKDGGFTLRKWTSNSKTFRERVASDEQEKDEPAKPIDSVTSRTDIQDDCVHKTDKQSLEKTKESLPATTEDKSVKILGLNWNVESDEFYFDPTESMAYAASLPPTKRSVLKLSAKIFDPIGILTPFTINMKCLFQTLCTDHVDWDTELDGKSLVVWKSLLKDLTAIKSIQVPRCYFSRSKDTIASQQIHGFCDASEKAYAAAVYLRTEYKDGTVEVNLVASKTRVAPLKRQTIPRLELLGANILARLVNSILTSISTVVNKHEVFLWTDSYTTLCWIKNEKSWKQYVQRRVNEIRHLTNAYQWNFCPGEINVADLPSRGCSGLALASNETWLHGSKFLKGPQEKWPKSPYPTNLVNETAMTETVKIPPIVTHSLITVTNVPFPQAKVEMIVDCSKYSTMTKLLRVTALILQFIKKLKGQSKTPSILTTDNLKEAVIIWIRRIQATAFPEVVQRLKTKQGVAKPLINQLGLFLDDNELIRCEGRLQNSTVPIDAKKPILLPSRHHFTDLIIRNSHEVVHHNGIKETLNCVRETYWVLRGRETVKRLVRKCITCKRQEGKSFTTPKVPPLPISRVSDEPPFTNTGLDFAGPLLTKERDGMEKSYVCLYTCASTRAVHLELVRNLSTDTFLQSFRRFASRRGLPKKLISDNAKTFKAAAKQLVTISRAERVQRYLTNTGVTWEFITERAPWHGGFWERLIKSTKRCLKKAIGITSLSFEELRTLLVEIEATLNNRPVTYIYDDEEGISYPLTPSCLIYGRRIANTPNDNHFEIVSTNKSLTRRAKHQNQLLRNFTNQWRKEYLLSLREHSKTQALGCETISVGDVVVLKRESTPRIFWKLAMVEELLPSQDNVVRSAKIRVLNKQGKKFVYLRRPIQHLVPLEISSKREIKEVNSMTDSLTEADKPTDNGRPKRKAAVVGEMKRKGLPIV